VPEFTFKVGLDAVFALVNVTAIIAPAVGVKFAIVTAFSAVPAAVVENPCGIVAVEPPPIPFIAAITAPSVTRLVEAVSDPTDVAIARVVTAFAPFPINA